MLRGATRHHVRIRPPMLGGVSALIMCIAPLRGQETGIFVMRADGTEQRKVVSVDGFAGHGSPRWSHDGKRLVFDAFDDPNGKGKAFVVNLDGTQLKEVGDKITPDWSPDDKQLIFHSRGENLPEGIWVQNVDTQGRERLFAGTWPRWSPDGGRVAFCDGNSLRVIDLADFSESLLIDEPLEESPHAFEWSHDGKRLALVTRRSGQPARELLIVASDGSQRPVSRFARAGNFGNHVSWSADDKQLLITLDSYIHSLEVSGDQPPQRIAGQDEKSRDPSFSPDAKWITFARRPR
jgi:Tol biopolymer transport system component